MLEQHIQTESSRQSLQWLRAPDVWRNLRNALAKWEPGTGTWFLECPVFKDWQQRAEFLWLTGIPGAGKTIISSAIVANLLRQEDGSSTPVIFYYFDFQIEMQQHVHAMLRSLLAQMAAWSPACLRSLQAFHDKTIASSAKDPSLDDLLEVVVTGLGHFPKIFVVVDALDECVERQTLLKHIKTISGVSGVHLLVLSRPERDIELVLQDAPTRTRLVGVDVDADIGLYIDHRMKSSDDMKEWDDIVKRKVREVLTSKAAGMSVLLQDIRHPELRSLTHS